MIPDLLWDLAAGHMILATVAACIVVFVIVYPPLSRAARVLENRRARHG